MFSPGARVLFEQLPALPALAADDARRVLSTVYLDLVSAKAKLQRANGRDRRDTLSVHSPPRQCIGVFQRI